MPLRFKSSIINVTSRHLCCKVVVFVPEAATEEPATVSAFYQQFYLV